ncbi:MAG: class I SAM-dependent methyltransferase [Planctomycetota bacterium]
MNGFAHKLTPDEIRARFDTEVERFSNLETGQAAQIDAPLMMDLLTSAALSVTPNAKRVLDLGCGAGNYVLKLLHAMSTPQREQLQSVTLVDLSRPMLDRATERIRDAHPAVRIESVQADVRDFKYGEDRFDVAMAAQCLHHLREDAEWDHVFASVFRGLTPGGGFWIADSLDHEHSAVSAMMADRWGDYLENLEDRAYREWVLAHVEKEDTPRPLLWQLDRLRAAGFTKLDVLHTHSRFGAFGGVKPEA